jgi:large repetitive protein
MRVIRDSVTANLRLAQRCRSARAGCAATALALAAVFLAPPVLAGVPLDTPFRVNTYTPGQQGLPAVSARTDGSFVVVWESRDQDGDYYGVFGQRFNSAGAPLGSEFLANTYTFGPELAPAVAALDGGAFVVVWQGYGVGGDFGDVFARRYDSAGMPLGSEFQVNEPVSAYEGAAAVAGLPDGGFVIVWDDYDDVFGRRYDSAGAPLGTPFAVNTYTPGSQGTASVAVTGDGGFVISFADGYYLGNGRDGDGYGVFARRFDSAGTANGSEFQVNTTSTGDQTQPRVAATVDGGFAIVWQSYAQSGTGTALFARRFGSDGAPAGNEFAVNAATVDEPSAPAIATDASGGFLVVWTSSAPGPSSTSRVMARRFDAGGTPRGTEFGVLDTAEPTQLDAAAAGLPGGEFVVVWRDDTAGGSDPDVFARRVGEQTVSPTATPTLTLTPLTLTPTVAATVTSTVTACAGDCNGNGQVTVDDLILAVNIALGSQPIDRCRAADGDRNDMLTVSELITAVNRALSGC